MSPRRYSMTKKMAATAEFRQRILEATIKLHGRKGIFGTSWKDIARAADVSVGTVYKHFPSLDELVPACGELLMERIQPPRPESALEIIGETSDGTERLRRVARELFAFYSRGGPHLESDLRERELPAMREWEDHLRGLVTSFVTAALADFRLEAGTITHISFLFDFPTFSALRLRGIETEAAAEIASGMAMSWIGSAGLMQGSQQPVAVELIPDQDADQLEGRT